MKLEAWAVGITAGSREVPGRKGLWQETSISYNNNNNNMFSPLLVSLKQCHFLTVKIQSTSPPVVILPDQNISVLWQLIFVGTPPVWNSLHVTLLAPKNLRWLKYFWKIRKPFLWIFWYFVFGQVGENLPAFRSYLQLSSWGCVKSNRFLRNVFASLRMFPINFFTQTMETCQPIALRIVTAQKPAICSQTAAACKSIR